MARSVLLLLLVSGLFTDVPLARAHDVDARLEGLARELHQQPSDIGLLLERAALLRMEDQTARAFADADAAVQLGGAARALGERGLCLERLGHRQRALNDLDAALEAMPARTDWLLARARLRQSEGNLLGASRDLERVTRLDADADVWLLRASVARLAEGSPSALSVLREGLAATRGAEAVALELARSLVQGAAWLELERLAAERLSLPGAEELSWRMFLADAKAGLGAAQDAKAERRRALVVAHERLASQRTAIALVDCARVLDSLGQRAKARAMLLEALEAVPSWAEPRALLDRIDAAGRRKGRR